MQTPRVKPNVNYGPWVIMLFIICSKCTPLVGDVNGRGGYGMGFGIQPMLLFWKVI